MISDGEPSVDSKLEDDLSYDEVVDDNFAEDEEEQENIDNPQEIVFEDRDTNEDMNSETLASCTIKKIIKIVVLVLLGIGVALGLWVFIQWDRYRCRFPNQKWELSNRVCNPKYNIEKCFYDGGDCEDFDRIVHDCSNKNISSDGRCDWFYNTEGCEWDMGDCDYFNSLTNCSHSRKHMFSLFEKESWIRLAKFQDGQCDDFWNTEECDWDGGDCVGFNENYPNCTIPDFAKHSMNDGVCNNYANKEECGWDGGDCISQNEKLWKKYPNCTGIHPYPDRNRWNHGFFPVDVGNGNCNAQYNFEECGYDDGDCDKLNQELWKTYPDCIGIQPRSIGDGYCDNEYNIEECGNDGGDCSNFNEKYPMCRVDFPEFLGDGRCSGNEYNTEECFWDGGDCKKFNAKYPNCKVSSPRSVGNGYCSPGYNNKDCDFDGGDCKKFNIKYPDCKVSYPHWIGDGYCHGGEYNSNDCLNDGGDCDLFNEKYPDCKVDIPEWVGDGICNDYRPYNTEECDWDGGDCL